MLVSEEFSSLLGKLLLRFKTGILTDFLSLSLFFHVSNKNLLEEKIFFHFFFSVFSRGFFSTSFSVISARPDTSDAFIPFFDSLCRC
jgi:hypothetical protein